MKKKDSIKIVDEEEAVISIDELMNLKNKQEKLYNLTEDEENDQFIKELKNFRKDLWEYLCRLVINNLFQNFKN